MSDSAWPRMLEAICEAPVAAAPGGAGTDGGVKRRSVLDMLHDKRAKRQASDSSAATSSERVVDV